jgi:hypothetical protein
MREQAFFKALLRFYPAAFRDEYGNQMYLMLPSKWAKRGAPAARLKRLRCGGTPPGTL